MSNFNIVDLDTVKNKNGLLVDLTFFNEDGDCLNEEEKILNIADFNDKSALAAALREVIDEDTEAFFFVVSNKKNGDKKWFDYDSIFDSLTSSKLMEKILDVLKLR